MVADIHGILPQLSHEFTNKAAVVQRELGVCQVHICGKGLGVTQPPLDRPTGPMFLCHGQIQSLYFSGLPCIGVLSPW